MSQQSARSSTGSSGYHAPDPPMPVGGYRRAVPRDVLTGAPLRPDTIKRHVRDHDRDRAQPVIAHHRAPRYHTPAVRQREMLPNLDDLLDDDLLDAADAAAERQAGDA